VQGSAAGARRHAASVVTGCAVTGIETAGSEIRAVATEQGVVETGTVVCAAGAWSPGVASLVGLDLPVEPVLREIGFTTAVPGLPDHLPLTVDFTTGFYFHREGPGLLYGMADRTQPPGFDAPADPAWLERVTAVAERRLPTLLEMGMAGGWKGYYEITPDHNALIGEAPDVSRFLYATGFSGHGFLQGPATGEIVRDLVLGREPFVDVAPLSAERFERAAPRPEHNVI
jgi:sarcosine oxidase subunit beta